MALNSGIQTYQILSNDHQVCIPSLSSILRVILCSSTHACIITPRTYKLLYVKLHLHIITLPEDQLNIFRKRVRESVQYEFQPFPGSRGIEHTFIERH